jgi:hypothetical protein
MGNINVLRELSSVMERHIVWKKFTYVSRNELLPSLGQEVKQASSHHEKELLLDSEI